MSGLPAVLQAPVQNSTIRWLVASNSVKRDVVRSAVRAGVDGKSRLDERLALEAVCDGLRPCRRHELPCSQRARHVGGVIPACVQSDPVTGALLMHAV